LSQSLQAPQLDRLHAAAAPDLSLRGTLSSLVEASKPRITRLVTITSGVGFVLGAITRSWTAAELLIAAFGALAGTALTAAGANTLNQWMERERDARMPRTASRPLPEGRITPGLALASGIALCLIGLGVLGLMCGLAPMTVSAATILTYLLLYTPLKPITPMSILVGAVPGALPPLIGWSASLPELGFSSLILPSAWVLFLIMFIWQVPHFLAIGWMYKDDYAAGGYKVLPVVDESGRRTARAILVWSVALVLITLAPGLLMSPAAGALYATVAGLMGVGFLMLSMRVVRTRERADARRAFIASVIHLPLLLVVLVTFSVVSTIF
jgi:protoheme IX farnesyltransferase